MASKQKGKGSGNGEEGSEQGDGAGGGKQTQSVRTLVSTASNGGGGGGSGSGGDDGYNGKKLKQSTTLCVAVELMNTTKQITGSENATDGSGSSLNETLSLAQCGQAYTAVKGDTCGAVTAAFRVNQTELAL